MRTRRDFNGTSRQADMAQILDGQDTKQQQRCGQTVNATATKGTRDPKTGTSTAARAAREEHQCPRWPNGMAITASENRCMQTYGHFCIQA